MMYSQRITVRSMGDTGQEEEFIEDRGEEEFLEEDTGEGDESTEDLSSSEEHTGSEGDDYVDPPPSLQQTDSVGCSNSLAPQTDEAPVPRETQSPCVVRSTDKDTEQDNDKKHQLTLQLAKNRPHRQTARKRIGIVIESESDGHEDDDDDYDPNEDAGASSDDAGGVDNAEKNTNSEETASRGRHYCALCDQSFCAASKLKHHKRTHTGEKPFRCVDCGKSFKRSDHLRQHRRHVHGQDDPYPCPDCVECFLTNMELRTHRALHSQERRKEAEHQKKAKREMRRDRTRFFSCKQKEGQTVSSFITELRALASGCGFGDEQETRIRDRILCGVIDKSVLRNTLRDETQLTLLLVEEKALATEKAKTDPHLYKARKKISIQSEPYHHHEDGGGSSDDAGKNVNCKTTTTKGQHYCTICDLSFRRAYELKRHSRSHTGEKPFRCSDCGKTFSQTYNLRHHRRRAHGQDNLYPCPDGSEVEKYASRGRHYCAICDQSFRRAYGLERHSRTHTGEKPFRCADCGKNFSQTYHLRKHRRHFHDEDNLYPCQGGAEVKTDEAPNPRETQSPCVRLTDKDTEQDNDQTQQQLTLQKTRPHPHKARKEVSIRSEPDGHEDDSDHNEDGGGSRDDAGGGDDADKNADGKATASRRPYYCAICDRRFHRAYGLERHSRTHTGAKPFCCVDCGKTFNHTSHLRNHRRLAHSQDNIYPYTCSRCDESFTSLAELTSHMPVHQGEEPLICPDCGQSFHIRRAFERHRELHLVVTKHLCNECGKHMASAATLKRHLLVHSRTRPHLCALCGQGYINLYDLKCHMRVHTGITQKRHACLDCGRTFSCISEVCRHQMMHTGEKPFRCLHCGKTFRSQTNVKVHMRTHTGEKPYACLACGKRFAQIGGRNKHMSRCHCVVTFKKKKNTSAL